MIKKNQCPFSHELEGEEGLPFVHSFPSIAWNLLSFLTKLQQRYGDIARYKIFGITNYLVSHPDDIAQVFKDEKSGIYEKKRFHNAMYPSFGNGLFNSYGKDWEKQRKQLQPFFKKSKASQWFFPIVNESLEQFKAIGESAEINAENVIQPLMQSIMNNILFGVTENNKNSKELICAIDFISKQITNHSIKAFIFDGFLNKLPTPGNIKYKAALKLLDETIRDISETKRSKDISFLSIFSQHIPPAELRDQLFTLYFAGQETTVSTILWVLYYLAKYPEHQEKARLEVLEHWPTRNDVKFHSLDHLIFLNAAIDESMRLSPAAYATYRDVEQDTQLSLYKIKKNALVALSMYITHRHPDLWEQPLEYKPERFLSRTNKSYAFYPYGGGKRMCIGMHLARMEITTIVALFVTEFKFTLKPGVDVKQLTHMTLKPKDGLALILESIGSE